MFVHKDKEDSSKKRNQIFEPQADSILLGKHKLTHAGPVLQHCWTGWSFQKLF